MLTVLQAIDVALGLALVVVLGRSTAAEFRNVWKPWSRGTSATSPQYQIPVRQFLTTLIRGIPARKSSQSRSALDYDEVSAASKTAELNSGFCPGGKSCS